MSDSKRGKEDQGRLREEALDFARILAMPLGRGPARNAKVVRPSGAASSKQTVP